MAGLDERTQFNEELCICQCGRSFSQHGALHYHQRSCAKTKKRLVGALAKAKEAWSSRKKRRVENVNPHPQVDFVDHTSGQASNLDPSGRIGLLEVEADFSTPESPSSHIQGGIQVETNSSNDNQLSIVERRPRRHNRRLPIRFRDDVPESLPLLPPSLLPTAHLPPTPSLTPMEVAGVTAEQSSASQSSISSNQTFQSFIRQVFQTPRNIFGLVRRYHCARLPSHDLEEHLDLEQLYDEPPVKRRIPTGQRDKHSSTTNPNITDLAPYPNKSSFLLGDWYWNHGAQKSQESFTSLLKIVGDPQFRPDDVRHTPWAKINTSLVGGLFNKTDANSDEPEWLDEDGWHRTPIQISVPFHSRTKNPGPKPYTIGDLYHRSLVSVIREKLENPKHSQQFHYEPFEILWKPTDASAEVRVYSELYTSPEFNDAHQKLQSSPNEPGCDLPKVVAALMFWSDATHLTSFGNAKLWPCYLFFGNESKYLRSKPSCHLSSHVAYFQAIPDIFKDFLAENGGSKSTITTLLTHCRREVLHAQWSILLDDEFLEAYEHGIVITCCDGFTFRFYPRIFTYSADYPEKVILASIRNMGQCPCPRCLLPRSRIHNIGSVLDMKQHKIMARVDDENRRFNVRKARDFIYQMNYAVDSQAVEGLLGAQSLVPTDNAFSKKLGRFGFNLFVMLVVDLLHEFELGIWKALFIHLLRMLETIDKTLVNELDKRFRQVPTFGRDTIRRFSSNVSELKKMAARDFEDLLQSSSPVFEGLFSEPHNTNILNLLFTFAHWHALAKLRMHTDSTLQLLDDETHRIGYELRKFSGETCSNFNTHELRRETDARKRRQSRAGGVTSQRSRSSKHTSADSPSVHQDTPLPKMFNLQTYKLHSLGDYADTIRRFGTSDSYSTETGELEHRTAKARYKRTDKKSFVKQLAQIERREARLRRIRAKLESQGHLKTEAVLDSPQEHHHIGVSQNFYHHIGSFLRSNAGDPAIKNFLPKLRRHILPRILEKLRHERPDSSNLPNSPDPISPESILFKHNRIYHHNIARLNYTTYDVRRAQDVLNASSHHYNIMVLAHSDHGDFFCYGRVLAICHVEAVYVGPGMEGYRPHRVEFLWVRWYRHTGQASEGDWSARKLNCIQFMPMNMDDAFGFIDPSEVLRGCHIVPKFAKGKLHVDGKGLSHCARDQSDWVEYYVNRFVDRDMVMRYHWGLAVGHTYARTDASEPGPDGSVGSNTNQRLSVRELDEEESEAGHQDFADPEYHDETQNVVVDRDGVDSDGLESEDDGETSGECYEDEESDDDMLNAVEEMYGESADWYDI